MAVAAPVAQIYCPEALFSQGEGATPRREPGASDACALHGPTRLTNFILNPTSGPHSIFDEVSCLSFSRPKSGASRAPLQS